MQYPVPAYTTFVIPTGATTGARIVFDGTTGLILVYNSSNVLVDSIGGPAGDIIQSGTSRSVGIQNGFLTFFTPGTDVNGLIFAGSPGSLTLESGRSAPTKSVVFLELNEGPQAIVGPTGTEPYAQFYDNTGSSVVSVLVSGAVVATTINGGRETWHVPGAVANWVPGSSAGGGVYQNIQYRHDSENNVIVQGAIHATAAFAAGNRSILTLPVGYRPAKVFNGCDIFHTNAADAGVVDYIRWNISTGGNFSISSTAAFAINDNLYIYAVIPLGDLP